MTPARRRLAWTTLLISLFAATAFACGSSDPLPGAPPRRDAGGDSILLGDPANRAADGGLTGDASAGDGGSRGDAGVPGAPPPRDGGATFASGSCLSNQDCSASVESCARLTVVEERAAIQCTPKHPGGAELGAACSENAACLDGLCLSDISASCTYACRDSSDCPQGFACAGYEYQPGGVTLAFCMRACSDASACAGTQNVCATQIFQRAGAWAIEQVCQAPLGMGALGASCTTGSDCRGGLCLGTTRVNACSTQSNCARDEACVCPGGGAPPCASGQVGSCVSSLCSGLCDDDSDCVVPGGPALACRDVELPLPDGRRTSVRSCARR